MPLSFWICAAVTVASAYVSLGFSIASLVAPNSPSPIASRYALARSIALAAVATIAFFTGSVAFLLAIAAAMTVVQACDAAIGVSIRDRRKTVGPAVIAMINLAALIWLLTR
ncbi:MAG: hypothetical protein QOH69_2817 [Actinomycetota bacterium]|jgi:hypothetical protein|nr:hypothetical protein [Actinomycetota bacterium]